MTQLLAITASPMPDTSVTNHLVAQFVDGWAASQPQTEVTWRDVGLNPPPHIDAETIGAFYTPEEGRTDEQATAIRLSETLVGELEKAEVVVIGSPMHNFTISSGLKTWIDQVTRVGRTFRYTEKGPRGLLEGKQVFVLTARGGDYSEAGPVYHLDQQTPYLRTALAFIGLDDATFVRAQARFRNWITPDGAAGPSGEGSFTAEAGRYHLYVSYACPWAHRTLIFRALKGLSDIIGVTVVDPLMMENGWELPEGEGPVSGARYVYDIYTTADPAYTGRATVPVLWDKKEQTIVSNESSEIIRMFNSAFDGIGAIAGDFYPADLRAEIDAVNDLVYANVNNGVYKCDFAKTQKAYEEAFGDLFAALDELEARLGRSRYLVGNRITEADWRLFTTLVRFDAVYFGHFKCNLRRIADYPNLAGYLRDLYQTPGVADTVNMGHIKRHYYASHRSINPSGIVPLGPDLDFTEPHGRGDVGEN